MASRGKGRRRREAIQLRASKGLLKRGKAGVANQLPPPPNKRDGEQHVPSSLRAIMALRAGAPAPGKGRKHQQQQQHRSGAEAQPDGLRGKTAGGATPGRSSGGSGGGTNRGTASQSGEAVAHASAGQQPAAQPTLEQPGQALLGPETAPPRNRNKFAGLHRPSAPSHPPADEAVSVERPLAGESSAAFQSKGSMGEGAMATPGAPEGEAGTAAAGGGSSVVVPAPPPTARQLARRERVKAKRRKQKGRGAAAAAAADAEDSAGEGRESADDVISSDEDAVARRLLVDRHRPAFGEQAAAPLQTSLKRKHWDEGAHARHQALFAQQMQRATAQMAPGQAASSETLRTDAIEAYRQSKRKGSRDGKSAATFASLKALVAGREANKPTSSEHPIVA